MPRVPKNTNEVRRQPLRIKKQQLDTDLDAFVTQPKTRELQQVARTAVDIVKPQLTDQDKFRLREKDAELTNAVNETYYGPDGVNGYVHQLGLNSAKSREQYYNTLNEKIAEIGKDLNDNQRAEFDVMSKRYLAQFRARALAHQSKQMQNHALTSTQSSINTYKEDIIKNYLLPNKVSINLTKIKEAVNDYGNVQGLNQVQKEEIFSKEYSDVQVQLVSRMMNEGQYDTAKEYYSGLKSDPDMKKSLTAESIEKLDKIVKSGIMKGRAQAETDKILNKKLSLQESLSEARKITDPEIRDSVATRVKNRFAEKKVFEKEQNLKAYNSAYDQVQKTKNMDLITEEVKEQLTPAQKNELKRQIDYYKSGRNFFTDYPTYFNLRDMASSTDPREIQRFQDLNLLEYRSKLDNIKLNELKNLQEGIRKQDVQTLTKIDGYRTERDIVNGALNGMNIDFKTERAESFRRAVDADVLVWKEQNKKASIPNNEVVNIVDKQMKEMVIHEGTIWDSTERFFEIDIDDVPEEERNMIEDAISRNPKIRLTNDNIVRYYKLNLLRKAQGQK